MADIHLYTYDNILKQLQSAPYTLGYYTLRFYAEEGKPVNRVSQTIEEFLLYPSGGTLRDGRSNIVFYDSRFDTYRGFTLPHLKSGGP
ncbi:MAG TPA: hypothetical protein VFG32_10010 [Bacteroidota bacterium]|jgi:hypothetical protein|nr:hypothetical protein [Bacteroidota bacterium]